MPDHLHLRHLRRAQGRAARAALPRRPAAAGRALARRPAPASSCGARPATGWSKSARNAFIAPWLRGAAALLHDARFDPHERLELLARERVDVLCMAPTEYRVIAKRAAAARDARRCAGSSPPARRSTRACSDAWHEATGLWIRDGYGQTETGQLTGHAARRAAAARLDGPPAAGRRARRSTTASSCSTRRPTRRSSSATSARRRPPAPWRTGDRVRADEDGFLYFEGRADDVIISAGYRIGPFEVESALAAPPRRRRGRGRRGAGRRARQRRARRRRAARRLRALRRRSRASCRTTSRRETAPYKYPRIVDFAAELPRTPSGKVRRAALRGR